MKRIAAAGGFNAAFGSDARKIGSIDALGFGANNKLQLQIADRFWIGTGPVGQLERRVLRRHGLPGGLARHRAASPARRGILNNYTGGDTSRLLNPTKPWSDTSDPSPAVRNLRPATRRRRSSRRSSRSSPG